MSTVSRHSIDSAGHTSSPVFSRDSVLKFCEKIWVNPPTEEDLSLEVELDLLSLDGRMTELLVSTPTFDEITTLLDDEESELMKKGYFKKTQLDDSIRASKAKMKQHGAKTPKNRFFIEPTQIECFNQILFGKYTMREEDKQSALASSMIGWLRPDSGSSTNESSKRQVKLGPSYDRMRELLTQKELDTLMSLLEERNKRTAKFKADMKKRTTNKNPASSSTGKSFRSLFGRERSDKEDDSKGDSQTDKKRTESLARFVSRPEYSTQWPERHVDARSFIVEVNGYNVDCGVVITPGSSSSSPSPSPLSPSSPVTAPLSAPTIPSLASLAPLSNSSASNSNSSSEISPRTSGISNSGFEDWDRDIHWFHEYFLGKDHANYVGTDGNGGPVVLTIGCRDERDEKFCALIRTPTKDERIVVTCTGKIKNEKDEIKELKSVHPFLASLKLSRIADPEASSDIAQVENNDVPKAYKFGVLYRKKGQTHEDDLFGNVETSPDFDEFLEFLGERITLLGWESFRGGLDVTKNSTGTSSVYTVFHNYEIMYHIANFLPYFPADKQHLERKRHVGNDVVIIIFSEEQSPYPPDMIKSEFVHVTALVTKVSSSPTKYQVTFVAKEGVRPWGPVLPFPAIFEKGPAFRNLFLTKLINAERAALSAPGFAQKLTAAKKMFLKSLVTQYAPTK